MLKQLDIKNRRGATLVLPMEENNSGYQVANIDGLNPVKATLVSSSFAGLDGAQFQSATRGPRNIKLSLDFQPDFQTETYTSLREKLYSFFMTKSTVNLRFYKTSGLYLDIEAVVEDVVAPMFEKDPDATISLMCFQPDFIDGRKIILEGATVSNDTVEEIVYPGTVESGTVLTLNANRTIPEFTIYNTAEDGMLYQLDFTREVIPGDKLIISSLRGAKGITLIRSGVSSSYLYGKSAQSSWIELFEGVNQFRVYCPGDPVPYELEYVVRYGGI